MVSWFFQSASQSGWKSLFFSSKQGPPCVWRELLSHFRRERLTEVRPSVWMHAFTPKSSFTEAAIRKMSGLKHVGATGKRVTLCHCGMIITVIQPRIRRGRLISLWVCRHLCVSFLQHSRLLWPLIKCQLLHKSRSGCSRSRWAERLMWADTCTNQRFLMLHKWFVLKWMNKITGSVT